MNEYTIYFTILNSKFKMKVRAYDKVDARDKVQQVILDKMKFYTNESFEEIDKEIPPMYNDLFNDNQVEYLKNIFGMK